MSRVALCVVVVASLLFFSVAIPQTRFESKPIEPLIDTPGKTIGSDFNGDGIHDLVVGAHLNDDFASNAGSSYILYGTPNLSATYDLSSLGGLDVTIQGKAATDYLGYEVSSGGDINSDGFDDLLLGAQLNNDAGPADAGAVFIIYGSPNLSATFRVSDTAGDVTVVGKIGADSLGFTTSGIGDFNGDGFDDVLMGAPYNDDIGQDSGSAYILYGGASLSQTYNISGDGVSVTLLGIVALDQFGKDLTGAGDLNLDGFDDVIVGALGNDDVANVAGAAYILYGGSSIPGTIRADNHDVTLHGKAANDYLGSDTSSLADINNDGFDDVMVGAFGNDDGVASGGAAYIFYGRRSLSGTLKTGSSQEDISLLGVGSAQSLGRLVSGLGDINDDGFFDSMVGAVDSDYGSKTDSGAAYVIYGGTSLPSNIPSGNSDVTILGRNASDALGQSIGVGDINDDGIPDIAVGARNGDGLTTDAGAAYIVFGSESLTTSIDLAGAGANVTIVGKNNGDRLGQFLGAGRMNRGP